MVKARDVALVGIVVLVAASCWTVPKSDPGAEIVVREFSELEAEKSWKLSGDSLEIIREAYRQSDVGPRLRLVHEELVSRSARLAEATGRAPVSVTWRVSVRRATSEGKDHGAWEVVFVSQGFAPSYSCRVLVGRDGVAQSSEAAECGYATK